MPVRSATGLLIQWNFNRYLISTTKENKRLSSNLDAMAIILYYSSIIVLVTSFVIYLRIPSANLGTPSANPRISSMIPSTIPLGISLVLLLENRLRSLIVNSSRNSFENSFIICFDIFLKNSFGLFFWNLGKISNEISSATSFETFIFWAFLGQTPLETPLK